jgi:hypothetical protein
MRVFLYANTFLIIKGSLLSVRLIAWQGLTEWDCHGPNGRLYCGDLRQARQINDKILK